MDVVTAGLVTGLGQSRLAKNANGPPPGIPLHPTQVYESLLNLVFYAALAALYRRKKVRRPGLRDLTCRLRHAAVPGRDLPRRLSALPAFSGRLGDAATWSASAFCSPAGCCWPCCRVPVAAGPAWAWEAEFARRSRCPPEAGTRPEMPRFRTSPKLNSLRPVRIASRKMSTKHSQKEKKQELGNIHRRPRQPAEPQNRRDDSED